MTAPELKPCPFDADGGHPILVSGPEYKPFVQCDDCGAKSGYGENDFEAVENWNRRAEPVLTEEEREALKVAIRELTYTYGQAARIVASLLARTDPNRKEGGA